MQCIFLIVLTLCLVIQQSYTSDNVPSIKQTRIIIVGAGASGIAAASKLFENGFNNVTIIEAEDRIGGRVWTTKFGNYLVDLGGQWVHGEEDNVAFNLAWPLDLLAKPTNNVLSTVVLHESSGMKIERNIVQNILMFYFNKTENPDEFDGQTASSLGEIMEKKFDEYFKDQPDIMNKRNMYLYMMNLMEMGSDAASSWYDVAISHITEFKETAGNQEINWKDRGYSTILDILMKRYPNPEMELPVLNNTKLYTEVSLINSSRIDTNNKVVVNTVNGDSYEADYVIVTPSLGVLKEKYKTLFVPSLPDWKVNAIEGLGFGRVAKIYFLYNEPFWTVDNIQEVKSFGFAWNDHDKAAIKEEEKAWVLGMIAAITIAYKPNLLCLWVVGEYVPMLETLPDDKVIDHAVENLKRFIGNDFNVTTPNEMVRTKWYSNPHFRGTYSYRSPKSDEMKAWAKALGDPYPKDNPRILFAGEATNPHRYSTVHGAIETGWSTADKVMSNIRKNMESKLL